MLPFWKHQTETVRQELDQDSVSEFSLARYAPMGRLLSAEDFEFLKAQPGYTPEAGRKFLRERRRALRLYLRQITKEFQNLHARARVIVASLPADNSALLGSLMRQQIRFWYEITTIRLNLSLAWTGVGSVDVSGLVNAVAALQAEVTRISAPTLA